MACKEWTGNGQPWQKGSGTGGQNCPKGTGGGSALKATVIQVLREKISGDAECSL